MDDRAKLRNPDVYCNFCRVYSMKLPHFCRVYSMKCPCFCRVYSMKSEIRQAVQSACKAVFTANTRSVCPLSEHKNILRTFVGPVGFSRGYLRFARFFQHEWPPKPLMVIKFCFVCYAPMGFNGFPQHSYWNCR